MYSNDYFILKIKIVQNWSIMTCPCFIVRPLTLFLLQIQMVKSRKNEPWWPFWDNINHVCCCLQFDDKMCSNVQHYSIKCSFYCLFFHLNWNYTIRGRQPKTLEDLCKNIKVKFLANTFNLNSNGFNIKMWKFWKLMHKKTICITFLIYNCMNKSVNYLCTNLYH